MELELDHKTHKISEMLAETLIVLWKKLNKGSKIERQGGMYLNVKSSSFMYMYNVMQMKILCVILCRCLHMSKYLIYGVLEGMWYFAPGSKSSSLLFTAGEIPWYLHLQGS